MSPLAKASLLLFFFSLCGSAMLVTHQVSSQRPPPTPHQLFAVVNDQISALRAADYTSAYRYAASGVQQKFTLPQFKTMALRSYGEMPRGQRVEFGTVRLEGGNAVLEVFLFDVDGTVRAFLYSLVPERETWKISGVEEVRSYRTRAAMPGTHA